MGLAVRRGDASGLIVVVKPGYAGGFSGIIFVDARWFSRW